MDRVERVWLLLPPAVRNLPADLAAALLVLIATSLSIFIPGLNETPLRVVFGLPFVLFIPGYAFIAALFPEAGEPPSDSDDTDEDSVTTNSSEGIDGIERVALSFGTSIAIVPLIGLILNFTPFGIRLVPIVVAVSGFTLVCIAIGTRRRRELPVDERFRVPYRDWLTNARSELFEPDTRVDAALNVLLVCSVILAAASVTYAVAVPKQGENFSALYLLTESDDGDLVADGYPSEFVQGEAQSLIVGVSNHEHQTVNYSVVVTLQRIRIQDNSTTVLEQSHLSTYETGPIAAGENWTLRHRVRPQLTGTNLRLTYLLYRGTPPADPSTETAYRENHLFINVTRSGTE